VGQWLLWCRLPMLSGMLLWLSIPPVGWSWIAWVALVPLLTLIRTPWRSRAIYRPALAGGLVFGLLAVQWIRYADDAGLTGYYGWWTLALYMAVYFPLAIFVVRVAVLRFHVPAILAVPIAWVGLEYLRSWLLSGFPWYFVAHTQFRWIRLIQISDLAGAYGVSFVVALVNGWIVDLLAVPLMRPSESGPRLAREQVWRFAFVLIVLAGTLGYGSIRMDRPVGDLQGPTVALIQTDVPQQVKADESRFPEINRQYLRLLDEAAAAQPDLVIWPETAYRIPLVTINHDVTDEDLKRVIDDEEVDPQRVREVVEEVREDLGFLAKRAGKPTLMGINSERFSPTFSVRFNSAVMVLPDGAIAETYHKIHLVPWGEYLPLKDWMPWLRIFTPHSSANYGLDAGTERVQFESWGRHKFGVLICFEDTLPWIARGYVSDGSDVDFLVNITNDGWFGVATDDESQTGAFRRAQHEAHLAASVFRAVECRRPLVRAVNTGISAIIDSSGRIVRAAGEDGRNPMASTVVVGEVPLDRRTSLYSRAGEWLGQLTLVLTAVCVAGGFVTAWSQRRTSKS
jgi:apolipoprotein N-acyltransferase